MHELINIIISRIGEQEVKTVNARDLHAFLGVRRDFTNWIKSRIKQYGFVEGVDYLLAKTGEQLPSGTKYLTEYVISIDMAKELSMVERTPKGREVRMYFIECERVALSTPSITLELHRRLMAYERVEKLTAEIAKRAARDMNDRKKALRTFLWAEKKALKDITQLRLFLAAPVAEVAQ